MQNFTDRFKGHIKEINKAVLEYETTLKSLVRVYELNFTVDNIDEGRTKNSLNYCFDDISTSIHHRFYVKDIEVAKKILNNLSEEEKKGLDTKFHDAYIGLKSKLISQIINEIEN